MYVCMCTRMCVYVCVYKYKCIYICSSWSQIIKLPRRELFQISARSSYIIHMYLQYIYTNIQTYIHTHTHTYICRSCILIIKLQRSELMLNWLWLAADFWNKSASCPFSRYSRTECARARHLLTHEAVYYYFSQHTSSSWLSAHLCVVLYVQEDSDRWSGCEVARGERQPEMVAEKGEGRGGSKSQWKQNKYVAGCLGREWGTGDAAMERKRSAKGKQYAVQSLYASAVSDVVVMPASGAALKFSPPR